MTMINDNKQFVLYRQEWSEFESGWGRRDTGYTHHLSIEDCKQHVKEYNAKHNNLPYAPDCYIQAVGDPQLVIVTEELYTRVYNEKHNIT